MASKPAQPTPEPTLEPLRTSLAPEAALERLRERARRGKLAGFEAGDGSGSPLCTITDIGTPFAGRLFVEGVREGDGTVLRFRTELSRLMPSIFAAVLIFTVWPGVWLTDSLLKTYFSWYQIPTWWWYLPLTVPFIPLSWRQAMGMSRRSLASDAVERREAIAKALGEG